VIERQVPGKTIRYAAVGLGAVSATTLHQLILKIDDCLLAKR
jgi:hypothetical protein